MKKLVSAALPLLLLLSLALPAFAHESVTPTPPSWVEEDEYLIFPGDPVYQPENWAEIKSLRSAAQAGTFYQSEVEPLKPEGSAGYCYELGLIRLKQGANEYAQTGDRRVFAPARHALDSASSAQYGTNKNAQDPLYRSLQLWYQRALLLERYSFSARPYMGRDLDHMLTTLNITMADFYDGPFMEIIPQSERDQVQDILSDYLGRVELWLDGYRISDSDVDPEIKNGRTMVPIRALAERLGADVEWVAEKRQITMTRAGHQVIMTLDRTTAAVDGAPVEMDVAPYVTNGRTLIPARYVAEFFGQKVEWSGETRRVSITEDKSTAGNSNLEDWAVPMGAILSHMHYNGVPVGYGRARGTIDILNTINHTRSMTPAQYARYLLSDSWGVESRSDLVRTVLDMTDSGHNAAFLEAAATVSSLSAAEFRALVAQSGEVDAYMWPYTKQLSEKWGDRGILCWDLFRMSNLVQWGYTAGYLTYAESLALLEPAVVLLRENFSSWDEAYENYLDGYNWWARNDARNTDIWTTSRGQMYTRLKKTDGSTLFDDSLFKTALIPVPGLTAQQLLAELPAN